MRRIAALALALLVIGCNSNTDLFPLEVGRSTTYVVRTGMVEFVAPLKVKGTLSVAGVEGYELEGPLGTYRVAWKNKTLLAERLGGTRFNPPLPMLVAGAETAKRPWAGRIGFAGNVAQAMAELEQKPATLTLGTKRYDCTEVRIVARMPGREIELITHYGEGIGILRQEQRVSDGSDPGNKTLFVGMDYLAGE